MQHTSPSDNTPHGWRFVAIQACASDIIYIPGALADYKQWLDNSRNLSEGRALKTFEYVHTSEDL